MTASRIRSRRAVTGQCLLLLGIIMSVFALTGTGRADTTGNPDTNTRADWDPAVVDATHGQTAGATLTGAVEGRVLKIHVDGVAGKFFGVNQARMCRSGLSISTASQMSPSAFGDCVPKPFQGTADDDPNRQDDSYVNAPADSSHTFVDFTFRVGSGTQTFNDSGGSPHTITCDSANPCSVWLQESVDTSIKSGGNIYKHYDIQYAASGTTTTTAATTTTTAPSGTTTTTAPTGTTTTTAPSGTTTTTAPSGTTTTTAPTGTTTTAPAGTTTTTAPAGTTTTTAPSATTTTTVPTATTTTTAPAGTTTTTAPSGTTTTAAPSATTTTTAPTGGTTTTAPSDTTTTTTPSGASVSPSSAPPGGPVNITSTGWKPCSGESTSTTVSSTTSTTAGSTTSTTACPPVTVVIQSDPITLGTLTPDSTGTVTGQFAIPAGLPAGSHTIVLSGTGADGTARTVSVPFTVTAGSGNSSTGGTLASVAGTGSGGSALPATGTRLKLLWFGFALSGAGGLLILSARRRARLLS